jgi:DNA ligase (NAD+)
MDGLAAASPEQLERIDGIGNVMAESIANWFAEEKNRALIERLRAADLNFESKSAGLASEGPFVGKVFVLTGTLPNLSRTEAAEKIEAAGGRTSSSVSAKTHYLLAGESAGSKLAKAEKLGITILSEEDFLRLLV